MSELRVTISALIEQFLLVDRFGEKAEGTHLRRLHGIGNRAVGGQDDHLQSRPAVLQLLQEPDAVHLIHTQIGDDEIGTEAARRGKRLRTTFHGLDVVVLGAQPDREQSQQSRIIVHDQDAGLAFACLIHGADPSVPGLRLLSERSMLVMASSLACASSRSLRSWAFSSISVCSRLLSAVTCSRSVRSALACRR